MQSNEIIQGLWLGKFGTMEQMCVSSYLRQGHGFNLFMYRQDWNQDSIPYSRPGFRLMDAASIVPEDKIKLFPSASIFSDFFRYALLSKRGGFWNDLDTLCLRHFDFTSDYVFASDNIDHYYISGCFMRAPIASPIMLDCYNWIDNLTTDERAKLGHMDIGPYLLQRKVPEYHLESFVQPPLTFDPIPWNHITRIVDPSYAPDLSQSYAIHLRQSIWDLGPNSSAGILPDGTKLMIDGDYPADCLWSKLKKELL